MPVTSELRRLRQEDGHDFQASLGSEKLNNKMKQNNNKDCTVLAMCMLTSPHWKMFVFPFFVVAVQRRAYPSLGAY